MIKFLCNKLGRDKGVESFKAEGITPDYILLQGNDLSDALKEKLVEESYEVKSAHNRQEIMSELADIFEVIDSLCKIHEISMQDIELIKEKKHLERGGFDNGFYLKTITMEIDNPKADYFRASPDKYPEV